jgi:hypothetical protein
MRTQLRPGRAKPLSNHAHSERVVMTRLTPSVGEDYFALGIE